MKKSIFLPVLLLWSFYGFSQIRSGPMVGYVTMREAAVWIQTQTESEVQLVYWAADNPSKRYISNARKAVAENAFAVTLIADSAEPGVKYNYSFLLNGTFLALEKNCSFKTQPLWQYRTDPPPFKIALGSCTYVNEDPYDRPGTPYGGGYEIFQSIYAKSPDAMLWLGDNVYLREADYYAGSSIFDRYTHTRSLPEMQDLLANTPNYAIWDDHDYGPNNANRSYWGKDLTLMAFKLFWPSVAYGIGGTEGITSSFTFHDVEFFMLDDRWYRSPEYLDVTQNEILGKNQVQWLIDALITSKAKFKMVCVGSQFLNSAATKENFSNCMSERKQIIEAINNEEIKNVVFLTGDRHHTELSKEQVSGGPVIYDLTVSPLTSGVNTEAASETNYNRVENTLITERNFGVLEFSGTKKDREMTIRIYNTAGVELWNKKIVSE